MSRRKRKLAERRQTWRKGLRYYARAAVETLRRRARYLFGGGQ